MTECGKIISINGDIARVGFRRRGECDKCRMCAASKDGFHSEISVENTLNLCEGDFVRVEVFKRKTQVKSVLLYIIAFVLTAIGAGLGTLMSTGASIVLGVAGLIVGLAFAVPIDVCIFRKKQSPKMTEACTEAEYIVNSK